MPDPAGAPKALCATMKIPIFATPERRRYLHLERQYRTDRPLISLGCNCEPAHITRSLHLRMESLPFDWLNTSPRSGMRYAATQITEEFRDFVASPRLNSRQRVVASRFPESEFLHHPKVLNDRDCRRKFRSRATRFLEITRGGGCDYVYHLPSAALGAEDGAAVLDAARYLASLLETKAHRLLIYISHPEDLTLAGEASQEVRAAMLASPNVRITHHTQSRSRFGQWGDPKSYPKLLRRLGVRLRPTLPRAYRSTEWAEDS